MARSPRSAARGSAGQPPAGSGNGRAPREIGQPMFGQPQPTADPTTFRIKHGSDTEAYHEIDELNRLGQIQPMGFPPPRGGSEPRLTLARVLGPTGGAATARIEANQQIVFHATGDCGSTKNPTHQNEVTDKMVSDFDEHHAREMPQFNLLLGDIVYSFGEAQYYYDQFYEPYRNYRAPILAVAGNHDGMIAPHLHVKSLDAFLRNFCADRFVVTPDAGGLSRTAQIQPGVFYTFEAPFVRILAFYSNMLEDPGVIANDAAVGDLQLRFLEAALKRVKVEAFKGALLFAHHHPPFTASQSGSRHGWSVQMLADMDAVCAKVGVWPHAVLAGHVHNYQRFTRHRRDGTEIPYVSCGNGGHNVQSLTRGGNPPRVPQIIQEASAKADQVVFENYDDRNYGYLRVLATADQLRVEYHAANDGPNAKAPDDSVTVDLATRKRAPFVASDHGHPEAAKRIRELRANQERARGRRRPPR